MIKQNLSQARNFIKFLGTAGARFVTISQQRASAGTWISFEGTNILIDPGPGSLLGCLNAKPRLDPSALDAIILTHKHLDHSNDINIMIEAMTLGGSKKRGIVFLPADMLGEDTILLKYARVLPERIVTLEEKGKYSVGSVEFETPIRHQHSVETYGLRFLFKDKTVSLIVDTKYFDGIVSAYSADMVIINSVLAEPVSHIDHLSLKEAGHIISRIKPKKAVLTHFGRDILKEKPKDLSKRISKECDVRVIAAEDGMSLAL